jgi:hypothetical protein
MFVVWPKLWTYYSFLATLDTPLAVPLRRRGVLPGLLATTLVCGTSVFLWPSFYLSDAHPWPEVHAVAALPGSGFLQIFWAWAAMWIVGLVFSISALRNARTEIGREQARAYLIAFGFRDVGFVLMAVMFTLVPMTTPYFHWLYMLFPTVWLVYYPLVAWGILQHQLFDIELKVKKGVQRSVVASAIAGGFFVGTYALEQFVNANNFVLGLIIAAVLTVGFQPLQRAAERFADRLMPGVDRSESYLSERRLEVYRSAIEAAVLDGVISERERAILEGLQQSLGVTAAEASAIEREATRALGAAGGVVVQPA